MGDRIPAPLHRKHRWDRRGRFGPYLSGDSRTCSSCGLVARRAGQASAAGWLLSIPGTTCRNAWRWRLPPCFGENDGARRAVSWNGRAVTADD